MPDAATVRAVRRPLRPASAYGPVPALRPAGARDAKAILRLMQPLVESGVLLPRTLDEIRAHIDSFLVCTAGRTLTACGSIRFLSGQLAELRSVVVAQGQRGGGLGRQLVEALIDRAASAGARRVCAITSSPTFFERLGFRATPVGDVPEKIAADCVSCSRRVGCRQVALVRDVRGRADAVGPAHILPMRPVWSVDSAGG